ncbi:hypothetical protein T07_3743 [Trichinella nelsoni]|uniref:Uncharacterized protein n=1 Tax=Trichinella nelsoni TaxID=6336 RepID=A0A0V0SL92_9BILA|nr:hypothetical protein T07_3743 [Trichinella nelsoni]
MLKNERTGTVCSSVHIYHQDIPIPHGDGFAIHHCFDSPALASQPIAKLATWIVDLVGIEFLPVTRDEVDFTNFTQTSPAETKRRNCFLTSIETS